MDMMPIEQMLVMMVMYTTAARVMFMYTATMTGHAR
jgi:hypothetical protein